MYDNYIELMIEGMTRGRELQDAFILVLREKEGKRFLPILIPHNGYDMITNALKHKDFTCSKLMNKLAGRVGMTMIGVRLMQPANGETQALLDFELVNEVVSITVPVAEAVVSAIETHSALWVQRDTFERQSRMNNPDKQSMALPLAAMSNNLLKEALKSAVEDDNFELASVLRDELNKRDMANNNE
mgnify:FL=1